MVVRLVQEIERCMDNTLQPNSSSQDSSSVKPMHLSPTPAMFITSTSDINMAAPDVNSVTFSRDGTAIVTTTGDEFEGEQAVWIWDAMTGALLSYIPSRGQTVHNAMFNADGRKLARAFGNRVEVCMADPHYNVTTAECWRWTDQSQCHLSLEITRPNGDPTGRWDPAKWGYRRWDTERLGLRRSDQSFFNPVPTMFDVAWHPDDSSLVAASSDEVARIWDVHSSNVLQILAGHSAAVRSARFSPDGTQVVTASADATARIWDTASGICLRVLSGHVEALNSAEWSPDGTYIVTGCSDGTIGLWEAHAPDRPPRIEPYEVFAATLASFSPDGTRIATNHGTLVRIWDHRMARCEFVLSVESQIPGLGWGIGALAWSPDSTRLAIGGTNAMVGIWEIGN